MIVNANKLLTFEFLLHVQLAMLLLGTPQLAIRIIGWPLAGSTFWPRLLGAVMAGIALAILATLAGWSKDGASCGIGLAALIAINLTAAFVLSSMVFLGPEHPTRRGAIFSGALAAGLLVLGLLEVAYL